MAGDEHDVYVHVEVYLRYGGVGDSSITCYLRGYILDSLSVLLTAKTPLPLSTHKRNLLYPALGLIIPGWGHAAQGQLKQAVLIQMSFYGALFLLALSRLIVTASGVYLFILVIIITHIYSAFSSAKYAHQSALFSRKKRLVFLLAFPLLCLLILLGSFYLKPYIMGIQIYQVRSISMEPTLHDGDFILVDTWHYHFHEPAIDEIVLFSQNGSNDTFVKRIAEKPEHYNRSTRNQFYLIGDNKRQSTDSRHFGLVHKENIKGKMKLRLSYSRKKYQS